MRTIPNPVILITGGASGIGRLMALDFAGKGATVVAWDINPSALASLASHAKDAGLNIQGVVCDVTQKGAIYQAAKQLVDKYGHLDILINNAGIVSGTRFLDTEDAKIEQTFAVNTLANFWTTKAFLPGMIERKTGHIVTIASAAGIIGVTGLADYSASKFAAFGFHESLRMELRQLKSPVRTTIVCPFFINTGLFDGVKTRFPLLLPILDQAKAAAKICQAIRKGKKRLIMPWFNYSVWLLRLFPVGFFDACANFFGINSSMDEFKGRKHG